MDFNKNYYQSLGIDKNANDADIKKSFRNLSKLYHPDKGGDVNKFKEINEASSILLDVDKRAQYDTYSPYGKNYRTNSGGFGGFGGFGNPYSNNSNPFEGFKSTFGSDIEEFLRRSGFRSNYQREEFIENLDIELNIDISLEEIYNNKEKEFTYDRNILCNTCQGTGEVSMNGYVSCHHCDGNGRIIINGRESICNNCKGTGKIDKKVCSDCNGSKVKLKKETLPLTNLFVLSDNARTMIYNGYGNHSKHYKGKVGKLIINLNPIQDEKYKKVGKDLYFKYKLDFKTAILGGNIEYEHLDGKTYSIKIPEKTNNNARFKLKEKGMMVNQYGNRGDLFIEIELVIDYSKLNTYDLELIKKIS
jgi:molecular chaperone DnaJ